MKAQDFLLDTDGDLLIKDGDLVIGPSDGQHIKDIMQSVPGWWKEFPLVGFNPFQFLNSRTSVQQQKQIARQQLEGDGFVVDPKELIFTINADGTVAGSIRAIRPDF